MLDVTLPRQTARLTLRPYARDDLAALHDLFGRADVCRYLLWEPMTLDEATALLERRLRQTGIEADGDGILLAAVDATGRMAGEFMLRMTSATNRQGELGWTIHPDLQGRGLATEGAREMLRMGFDELGLHRIMADCDPRNAPSVRVMERIGMRQEAHFREDAFVKGEWVDTYIGAILEDEWRRISH